MIEVFAKKTNMTLTCKNCGSEMIVKEDNSAGAIFFDETDIAMCLICGREVRGTDGCYYKIIYEGKPCMRKP